MRMQSQNVVTIKSFFFHNIKKICVKTFYVFNFTFWLTQFINCFLSRVSKNRLK